MGRDSLIEILPSSTFVEFETKRVRSPSLIWSSNQFSDAELLEHSYCAPLVGDDLTEYDLNDSKIYLAERYGGHGIAKNAGGSRCGVSGKIQVKGIGKNSLVGSRTGHQHSHGGAWTSECIREVIYTEVCKMALPHGAADIYGIIQTPTKSPAYLRDGVSELPRALLLREPVIRPAHFMRAMYAQDQVHNGITDRLRTVESVQAAHIAFSSAYPELDKNAPDFIERCFYEMLKRIAEQVASAKAKKIFHGALIPSNVAIDGKYLDFGSMSIIPDYGRVILVNNYPDSHHEETPFTNDLFKLVYYFNKYGNCGLSSSEAKSFFTSVLNERMRIEFVKLTGLTEDQIELIDRDMVTDLWSCIRDDIVEYQKGFPFKWNGEWTNTLQLGAIISRVAGDHAYDSIEMSLRDLIHCDRVRTRFATAYSNIALQILRTFPHDRSIIATRARCLNTDIRELQRPILINLIDAAIENGTVNDLIDSILNKARAIWCSTP